MSRRCCDRETERERERERETEKAPKPRQDSRVRARVHSIRCSSLPGRERERERERERKRERVAWAIGERKKECSHFGSSSSSVSSGWAGGKHSDCAPECGSSPTCENNWSSSGGCEPLPGKLNSKSVTVHRPTIRGQCKKPQLGPFCRL